MTIRSRAASQSYREGWDAVFGRRGEVQAEVGKEAEVCAEGVGGPGCGGVGEEVRGSAEAEVGGYFEEDDTALSGHRCVEVPHLTAMAMQRPGESMYDATMRYAKSRWTERNIVTLHELDNGHFLVELRR